MTDEIVDIVISTCDRGERIGATIQSIQASAYRAFTLWVLDQSADDLTQQTVAPYAANDVRIRYLRVPNQGGAATRNYGASLGSASVILFTNDDCLVDPGWVGAMRTELQDERLWMVFGRVLPGLNLEQTRSRAGTILALKQSPAWELYGHDRLNLGFGHGHNLGVSRTAFQRLGGFDECLGPGAPFCSWDDLDIGYRAMRQGGYLAYAPAPLIYHYHWQNWQGVARSYRSYGLGAGASAAKYMRCGDLAAGLILLRWVWYHGLRMIMAGAAHRQPGRVLTGLGQLVEPWRGFKRGLQHPLERQQLLFRRELPPAVGHTQASLIARD
jgi:GT2 family glycosyltransferase